MSLMSSLALRQLKLNRRRTIITLVGIMLSVAMITAVAGFVSSVRDMMHTMYIESNGDYHCAFIGVDEEQAQLILSDSRVESGFTKVYEEQEYLGVFFRLAEPTREYEIQANEIAGDYGVVPEYFQYYTQLLATEGIIAGDATMTMFTLLAAILIGMIVVASVLVISNAFTISASERTRQFGILKSVGATRQQTRNSVLAEGVFLACVGIPLGIALGIALEAVALTIANSLLSEVSNANNGSLHFNVILEWGVVAIAAVLSFATIMLSAWIPARKASRIPAIDAIRGSGEYKIKPGKLKTSRLIMKIFGFEGTLASKALKRNKKKYRPTLIALVVSIVLFLVSSFFGSALVVSASLVYGDFDANAIAIVVDADSEASDALDKKITAIPDASLRRFELLSASAYLDESLYTKSAQELLLYNEAGSGVIIISISDEEFEQLLAQYSISSSGGGLDCILLNRLNQNIDGVIYEISPFVKNSISSLAVESDSEGYDDVTDINVIGEISDQLTDISEFTSWNSVNILVNQTTFRALQLGEDTITAYWLAKTGDSTGFVTACEEIFSELGDEISASATDIDALYRIQENLYLLIMVFVYGFVILLSVIGVTSVISTISTSVDLRAQEFAMLTSVGMTPEGMRKMLNLESLLYGIKSIAIGIVISYALSYALHAAFGLKLEFAFEFPWLSALGCVAAVMLLTFATMRYSVKRYKKSSIVETLRNTNI